MAGKWESSSANEHTKSCHGSFDWLHQKTLAITHDNYKRKIRESIEINNAETKKEINKGGVVLNRDRGNLVHTDSWKPLFCKINNNV